MMTETLMAVEPQEEEQTHPTPAAFVADEIPRLEPAEAEPVVLSSAETQLLRGEASGIPAASFPVRKDAGHAEEVHRRGEVPGGQDEPPRVSWRV